MRAVILAGGKGTRLAPYTTVLPKPLLPLGDRPILALIIQQLANHGFEEIDISVGHLGGLIRAYFDEGDTVPEGVTLRYHWESEPLGTAGALNQIPLSDEPILVMNGDILTDLDYAALMNRHCERGVALTIATYRKDVSLSLGVIEGSGEIVTGYVEKPTLHYEVSMGVYIYSPIAVAAIPPGRFDFPDVVLRLIEQGRPVGAFPFNGAWFDIGTPEEYERATAFLSEHSALFAPGAA